MPVVHRFGKSLVAPAAVAACLFFVAAPAAAAEPADAAAAAFAPLIAAYDRAVKPGAEADAYRGQIERVLRRVQRSYALEVDPAPLVAAGVKAIEALAAGRTETPQPAEVFKRSLNAALATLDPYSNVLDAGEFKQLSSSLAGTFAGLGLEIEMANGLVRVVAPMEDSPAARAGLRRGDLIVKLDDQQVLGMTRADAVARMRGQPGTPIALLVRREGLEQDFLVPLVREVIRTRILRWSMEGEVLVLRLAQFAGSLKPLIDAAIAEASAQRQPQGIVLDMRGNPGGSVTQAVAAADAFLTRGEIVSMRGRTPGNTRSWSADAAESLPGVPMVVLINGGSASASELVAGALQDNGRATVMGERSFGKGSVQTISSLGEGLGALRLTTALYYTPSGRSVQRTGIGPDIELMPPAQATPPRPGRREEDRGQAMPGNSDPKPPKARVEQALCPRPAASDDRQLGCALAFLRAGSLDRFSRNLELGKAPNP